MSTRRLGGRRISSRRAIVPIQPDAGPDRICYLALMTFSVRRVQGAAVAIVSAGVLLASAPPTVSRLLRGGNVYRADGATPRVPSGLREDKGYRAVLLDALHVPTFAGHYYLSEDTYGTDSVMNLRRGPSRWCCVPAWMLLLALQHAPSVAPSAAS